jgi:hypothetical protein
VERPRGTHRFDLCVLQPLAPCTRRRREARPCTSHSAPVRSPAPILHTPGTGRSPALRTGAGRVPARPPPPAAWRGGTSPPRAAPFPPAASAGTPTPASPPEPPQLHLARAHASASLPPASREPWKARERGPLTPVSGLALLGRMCPQCDPPAGN